MDRKNIDRIFQEKFKDFYAEPPEGSWEKIEFELNKKEISAFNNAVFIKNFSFFFASFIFISAIVFIYLNDKENTELIESNITLESVKHPTIDSTESVESVKLLKDSSHISISKSKNSIVQKSELINKKSNTKNSLVSNSNQSEQQVSIASTIEDSLNYANKSKSGHNNKTIISLLETGFFTSFRSLFNDNSYDSSTLIIDTDVTISENIVEIDEREKLQIEKEDEFSNSSESVGELNRWQLTPTIASVFFNTLGNGSPIDERFINSEKTFSNSVSAGVGLSYRISDKLMVKSGMHIINLSYITHDVIFFPNLNDGGYSTITYEKEQNPIFIDNANSFNHPNDINGFGSNNGNLEQRLNFLEIPMELSYFLLNNDFGLRIVGGFSSFIAVNNSLHITSENFRAPIGIANNINPIHFSTNIGLGVDYQFLKSFRASVEPMFKYQLNTFSNNPGNFRPYFIGIYSGISYQF